ncbi:MAG TPA: hypothetical protein VF147_17470 [Vicinamibacterales bacterium]
MEVFLVPARPDRYELYCEVPDEPHDEQPGDPPKSRIQRVKHYFSVMLAEAERERKHGRVEREHAGWAARLKAKTMRWVAEAIAEQRLLWHLRKQASATLFYPDDMTESAAVEWMRGEMSRDFARHRLWLIIDSLLFIGSGVLFFVPGPNVVAYYFAFRMVGHYLSLRGAKHGLDAVAWTPQASAPLAALRQAITMEPGAREERVQAIAGELGLEHLARFVERTAVYFSS